MQEIWNQPQQQCLDGKKVSGIYARRLKALEEENLSLKRLLGEKELEIQVLRDVVKKNY